MEVLILVDGYYNSTGHRAVYKQAGELLVPASEVYGRSLCESNLATYDIHILSEQETVDAAIVSDIFDAFQAIDAELETLSHDEVQEPEQVAEPATQQQAPSQPARGSKKKTVAGA